MIKCVLALTVGVGLVLAPVGTLGASTSYRYHAINGSNACTPVTPTASLRSYVSGLRNAGTESVYITCGLKDSYVGNPAGGTGTGVLLASAWFKNFGATPVIVKCVLYSGPANDGVNFPGGSFPASISIDAYSYRRVRWDPGALLGDGAAFANISLSCSLPSNTSLSYIDETFGEYDAP